MEAGDCFICRKHARLEPQPPGGYFFEALHFRVCHAPLDSGPPGTLLVESRRHYLDYAEMTHAEAASYALLLSQLFSALRQVTQAERIYQLLFVEGVPHFHSWLVPRRATDTNRGVALLQSEFQLGIADVITLCAQLAAQLREENMQ